MDLGSIMTRSVVTVEMDDSLKTIRDIFNQVRFHHLVVVEQGRICGVISDRDLLKWTSPYLGTAAETERDTNTLKRHAHQIMSRRPVTASPDMRVSDAARLLLENDVSCLPVCDDHGGVEGIVTWKDLFQAYLTVCETDSPVPG